MLSQMRLNYTFAKLVASVVFCFCLNILIASPSSAADEAKQVKSNKDPYLAGLYGELFPGAGYFYLGENKDAYLSAGLILPIAAIYYVPPDTRLGAHLLANSYDLARNLFGFTVYDSFEDGLDLYGRENSIVDIPHYSFKEMIFSPLDIHNYSSWKVFVPLAIEAGYLGYMLSTTSTVALPASFLLYATPLIFIQTAFIGMGEESEFRGYQYPAFSKVTHSKIWGSIISSAFFGTCHVEKEICNFPYGVGNIFYLTNTNGIPIGGEFATQRRTNYYLQRFAETSIFGAYASWLVSTEANGFKKAIAIHAIGDFLVFMKDLFSEGDTPFISFNFSI
jgi:membrane protease YdiL (CAAX protease family)